MTAIDTEIAGGQLLDAGKELDRAQIRLELALRGGNRVELSTACKDYDRSRSLYSARFKLYLKALEYGAADRSL